MPGRGIPRNGFRFGGVAQLGERLLCKQEVIGSIPFTSTISWLADPRLTMKI
jgi:hypothetical protein